MSHEEWLGECPIIKRKPVAMSLKRLALMLGVSLTTLDKYRSGTTLPKQQRMENIAVFLQVPVNELAAEWNTWRMKANG